MPKSARQIPVSKVIRMLIEDGYSAVTEMMKKTDGYEMRHELAKLEANFRVALSVAKKFGVHRNTLDFVIRDYVARSKRSNFLSHSLDLPCSATILEFVKLGASRPAIESLAKEFARQGMVYDFVATTKILGREPQEVEVILLVNDYLKGATENEYMEKKLIDLACGVSNDLAKRVEDKISARRRQLALHCD
ncbi:MAG: hypothetical protein WAP51_02915 [Candidatus Sungiibacteriota bacterium]